MKKAALSLPLVCIMTVSLCVPTILRAADIAVGASAWYTSWNIELEDDFGTIESEMGLMYGPVFSVAFLERWSLAGLFLYGKFEDPEMNGASVWSSQDRYDFDLTVNFAINKVFRIFAGGKYVRFNFHVPGSVDPSYTMYGPGGGLSATFNIWANLYLTANASYVYMKGEAELTDSTVDIVARGVNASMALAWYIVPASTTLYIGGRYQRLLEDRKEDDNFKYHEMLGVTTSVTYSFSI